MKDLTKNELISIEGGSKPKWYVTAAFISGVTTGLILHEVNDFLKGFANGPDK